jgi:hypothetical protein
MYILEDLVLADTREQLKRVVDSVDLGIFLQILFATSESIS